MSVDLDSLNIVLAHDWLVGLRGGEWVLDRLARRYGPTELYTLVADGNPLTDAIDACHVVTSPLQAIPGASGAARRHLLPLMPWAVSSLNVAACDLVLSTSSAVMKSIRPPAGVPHVCYCHSPARYLWEQSADYASGRGGLLRRIGLGTFGPALRRWDRRTASRVDVFIANSEHTRARIRRVYDRDADVVHPPVRTTYFTPDESVAREPWYLIVAALEPYKRTELVIEAARRGGFPLKVVGSGSLRASLEEHAGPNVEFTGRVDDETLRDYYRRARALFFPQMEDFGIIAVEAQAAGCPVIAFAPPPGHPAGRGGAAESVRAETGILFPQQTVESILEAVDALETRAFSADACCENAAGFSEELFDQRVADVLRRVVAAV